jgi:hypothetical protein
VTVRDLKSNKINFVPIKDSLNRITAMTSAFYLEKSVYAVAFVEDQIDVVSFEIFSTNDPEKITSITGRIKVSLPKIEQPLPTPTETKQHVACEYHKTDSKHLTS